MVFNRTAVKFPALIPIRFAGTENNIPRRAMCQFTKIAITAVSLYI